jgi:hypothetical protein
MNNILPNWLCFSTANNYDEKPVIQDIPLESYAELNDGGITTIES